MMAKAASAVRPPAADMGDILTGSGLEDYLRKCMVFHLACSDAFEEAADLLRRAIIKSGRRYLFRADGKLAARRITKPLRQAAAANYDTARMMQLCLVLYRQQFADAHNQRSGAGEFNPDK